MTDKPEQIPGEPDAADQQAGGAGDIPEIEDSNAPDTADPPIEESVAEDDPELLDAATRTLDVADDAEDGAPSDGKVVSVAALADDSSDTESIIDDAKPADDVKERAANWSNERSAHRIAIELKHVEAEVRRLLENNDSRRKRRLAGTRRWFELEEDIISWRFTGRPDEDTLAQVSALVAKRHYLFKQLEFLTTIRPGWRSQPS